MDRTFCGDGRGWIRISAGRVGMGVQSAGMGGDGTKIPSPLCTPLVPIGRRVAITGSVV